MGDVRCLKCSEPWDSYYLRHELTHEANYELERRFHKSLINTVGESVRREILAKDGWLFGSSRLIVLYCPCCGANERANENMMDDAEILAEIAEITDEDGLQTMIEDMFFKK